MATNWIIEIVFDEDTPEGTVDAVKAAIDALLQLIDSDTLAILKREESEEDSDGQNA